MGRDARARLGGGRWLIWFCLVGLLGPVGLLAQVDTPLAANDSPSLLRASVPAPVRADGRLEYQIGLASSAVAVDGRLDDGAWLDAVRIPLLYEVSPAENMSAPVMTECMLTHDAEHLYLGCTATDPDPSAIRAYVVDRDGIDGHDRVVLTLDPFNDQRRAFQFGISALGVQSDAVLAQQGAGNPDQGPDAPPIDPSWDAIWASAGALTADGYVVEAAIPFRSLRFPSNSDGASWGVYLTRWWPRSSNVEMRSATRDRGNSCLLCQANLISGIRGGTSGANVQFTPTLTSSRTDLRADFPSGPITAGRANGEAGLDAQWGITSDMTLNLTANPDFSQVEADVAQLDVNSRFALFFPEKRPFFLEGADFFGTPINAVFTRSISDPVAGAKLSGKLGDNALGALMAKDRRNNLLIPGSQFSSSTALDGEVTTAIGRFRRDIGASGTVGALYTGREAAGYHNRVGGFDAFYRPVSSLTLQGQVLHSNTLYPAAVAQDFSQHDGGFNGTAARTVANWATRDWTFNADYRRIDEDFRADAGFLTQAGVQGGSANLARRWSGAAGQWFTQIRLNAGTWRNDDFSRNTIDSGMWFGLQYEGPGQSRAGVWPNLFKKEHYAGVTYEGMWEMFFDVSAAPSGTFSAGLNGNIGDAIDYANERLGSQVRFTPRASVRIGRNVEATLQHTYQRLSTGQGDPVFTANLSQLRAVYNFSPRSFVRTIVQYTQTDRAPDQYVNEVDRSTRAIFAQVLYAYKLSPQTVLFLGYSQNGDGEIDPDRVRIPLTTRGRTLFFKLGYAWRP